MKLEPPSNKALCTTKRSASSTPHFAERLARSGVPCRYMSWNRSTCGMVGMQANYDILVWMKRPHLALIGRGTPSVITDSTTTRPAKDKFVRNPQTETSRIKVMYNM